MSRHLRASAINTFVLTLCEAPADNNETWRASDFLRSLVTIDMKAKFCTDMLESSLNSAVVLIMQARVDSDSS